MFSDRARTLRLGLFTGLVFFFSGINIGYSQTVVKGHIKDAGTKKPLPFVSVFFPNSPIGTNTNDDGYFELRTDKEYNKIQVSYVGYQTVTQKITPGKNRP